MYHYSYEMKLTNSVIMCDLVTNWRKVCVFKAPCDFSYSIKKWGIVELYKKSGVVQKKCTILIKSDFLMINDYIL